MPAYKKDAYNQCILTSKKRVIVDHKLWQTVVLRTPSASNKDALIFHIKKV